MLPKDKTTEFIEMCEYGRRPASDTADKAPYSKYEREGSGLQIGVVSNRHDFYFLFNFLQPETHILI